jgi:DNA-binding winged helix-turn-helix (wHTH) protein/TolB-like protein/Tfp pilus assembly protein PilF
MTRLATLVYEFGPFRIDTVRRLLLRNGEVVQLTPKAFDTLVALVENNDRVLEKDELLRAVWADTVVEERNLTVNISTLRKALGEGANEHRYIVTVPGRGYRFAAGVRELQDDGADLIVEHHTRSHIIIHEREVDNEEKRSSLEAGKEIAPPIVAWRRRFGIIAAVLSLVVIGSTAALVYFLISSATKRADSTLAARNSPVSSPTARSIAVLPFKTLGNGKTDQHLSLGLADALITRLGNLKQLTVRPTSAVQRFGDDELDPVTAGRELNVELVLDSRVQRIGDRIRVTVQLINTVDGATLWTEKFDGRFTDIFAVQDSISNQLAQTIRLNLTDEERKLLTKRHTDNTEAYEAYLKGRYFWNKRTQPGHQRARAFFQQAIALDPGYAQAYVGLADSYAFLREHAKVKEQLVKALELDDTLADAHASLAFNYKFCTEWDWEGAEAEFKRALEINPNYATAHHWYAYYLAAMGRSEDAINEIKRARELDPLSIIINTDVGEILYYARRYDEAIAVYRISLEMDPNFGVAHYLLAYAYEQKGMYDEAIREFQKALPTHAPGAKHLRGWLGRCYALKGMRDEAGKILNELKALPRRAPGLPLQMTSIHAALGDKDQAFEWLERAYEEHDYDMIQITMDPRHDSLRSDPRFQDLLRRMNLRSS